MKTISLIAINFIFLFSANAKTTLEFDLTAETTIKNKSVKVDIKNLNAKLKREGLDGLPERLTVAANPIAFYKVLEKRIKAAAAVSKTELRFTISSGYLFEYPEICYNGEGSEVGDIIKSMAGNFLHRDQGLLATKFKDQTTAWSAAFESNDQLREYYGDELPDEVETWNNYDVNSDDVLVMSNLGPQGDSTELYSTFIKPCKN